MLPCTFSLPWKNAFCEFSFPVIKSTKSTPCCPAPSACPGRMPSASSASLSSSRPSRPHVALHLQLALEECLLRVQLPCHQVDQVDPMLPCTFSLPWKNAFCEFSFPVIKSTKSTPCCP